MPKLAIGLLVILALSACSKKAPTTTTTLDPRDTVWGDQVKAMDKARSVEQTLQQAAERTRAADAAAGQ